MTITDKVAVERARQDAKWSEQNHPDGTGQPHSIVKARIARNRCQYAAQRGAVTWEHILDEEVREAFAETDTAALRAELIQVAAVAVARAEALDRRSA